MDRLKSITISLTKYLLIIISIVLFIIGILSIFITARLDNTFFHQSENTIYEFSFGIIPLIVAIFITIITYIFNKKIFKKINHNILLTILLVLCTIIFAIWVHVLKLYPISDQKMIYDMAVDFNKNHNLNNHLVFGQYLYLYPFQIGLVLLVSHIFKILGENYLYIEYLNVICSIVNMFLLYRISQTIFEKKEQKALIILEALFSFYWMFFNEHFYGNIIGLTFALLSAYTILLFTKNNRYRYLLLSAVTIALSIIIKKNYSIFLCGIIIYLLFEKIIKKQNPLKVLIIFIAIYCAINLGFKLTVKYLYKIDLPEGLPMITYVYMGMSEPVDKAPGWYSDVPKTIHDQNAGNNASIINSTKKLIGDRIIYFAKNPGDFVSYFSQKFASTWLNPTFQTIWCSIPGNRYRLDEDYAHYLGYHEKILSIVGGDLYKIEEKYFDALEIVIFVFSGMSLFSTAYRINGNNKMDNDNNISNDTNEINMSLFLLPLIFIGGLAFHLIWETKAIYVIQYYYLLLPYAADGITKLKQ